MWHNRLLFENLGIFPTQRAWPHKFLGEDCFGFGTVTERIPLPYFNDLFYTNEDHHIT